MNREERLNLIKHYKGYEIDFGMVPNGVTVFFEGEEVFFRTEKEAQAFIDTIEELYER